jgi:cephalosporin hydroxylase
MTSTLSPAARPHRGCTQADLIDDFNRLYYHGPHNSPLYMTTSWLGVPTLKCPMDLWIYQEILQATRPEVIVETGVHCGGSSLYLAGVCDLLGLGHIVACDISLAHVASAVRNHPRISLLEGNSVSNDVLSQVRRACAGRRTMVVLDSDHARDHVLRELECYGPLVTPGCYMICEDTNINGHPSLPEHGPGPYEAVQEFLSRHKGWQVDEQCERLLVTFNPSGYLLKLPTGQ